MERSFSSSIIRQSFAVFSSLFFLSQYSFAQSDNVNLASTKYKPNKETDCETCTCICLQGSIDFANIHETYAGVPGGYYSGYKNKVGFNFGVFATHPVLMLGPGNLAARAGFEFIQKGGVYGSGADKEDYRFNYIELPIDAIYQYQIKDVGKAFAGFGPYFAYGIGGKIKYGDGSPSDNAFGGQYGAKRFDFGLQFIGGFQLSCMASISLSYDLGLLNVSGSSYSSDYRDKNGVFSINLSYCLGGLLNK